jgi:ANTAR domain
MTSDVIDQAIEKLIDRYDIDADAALALITRLSTHSQQPVSDVARRLSAHTNAPTKDSSSRDEGGGRVNGRTPRF